MLKRTHAQFFGVGLGQVRSNLLILLVLHGGMAATSDSSSPWRHGRKLLILLLHGGMAATSDSSSSPWRHGRKLPILSQSYENFSKLPILHSSKLLTKTSQNFQTSTLFQSYTLPNFLRKLLKSSVENFSKLPILHSSNPLAILRKLPIPPLLVMKTSNSSTFGYETPLANFQLRKLETSNPLANFQFLQLENLKNLQSYTLPTTSNPPLLVTKPPILHSSTIILQTSKNSTFDGLFFNGWKICFTSSTTWKSLFSATFPPKCVF